MDPLVVVADKVVDSVGPLELGFDILVVTVEPKVDVGINVEPDEPKYKHYPSFQYFKCRKIITSKCYWNCRCT